MKEVIEKEIKYAVNTKAKENLKKIKEYIESLETIIYKMYDMQVLNDNELEIYKKITKIK